MCLLVFHQSTRNHAGEYILENFTGCSKHCNNKNNVNIIQQQQHNKAMARKQPLLGLKMGHRPGGVVQTTWPKSHASGKAVAIFFSKQK